MIFKKINQTTYSQVVKNNFEDRLEVEVGDLKQPDFKPQVKIMRWDNEVNLSIRAEEKVGATVETAGEVIKYITPDYEVHQYDKPSASEDGGFEFEWLLKKKPTSNVLSATIQSKELTFCYQSELTQKEIDEGCVRPENIVGSYAVYHSTKTNYKTGSKNYKCGKAFHIYRPKAIDSNNNEVWCELNIDEAGGILTVTVPQDFLDSAVYPIIVDPTLGYDTIGGTHSNVSNNSIYINGSHVMSEDGVLNSISIYHWNNSSTGIAWRGVIYLTSDYSLVAVAPTEDAFDGDDVGNTWRTTNMSGESLVDTVGYFLGIWHKDWGHVNWDSASGFDRPFQSFTYHATNDPADPFVPLFTTTDRKYSFYATYTAPTPVTITKSLKYAVILADSVTKSLKYTVITTPVAVTKSLKYTVVITPTAVIKSLQYVVVATIAAVTKSLKYTVITTPATVTKSLKYTVLETDVINKTLQYLVVASQSVTKSLYYEVTSAQSVTKDLRYVVTVTIAAITKSLTYSIFTAPLITKDLKYTIIRTLSATKSLTYAIIKTSSLTKSLLYKVTAAISVTKTLQYTIVSVLSVTKSLQYFVTRTQGITKNLSYIVVSTPAAITKSFKYTIVGESSLTKSLKYTILDELSITKALEYQIVTAQSLTKSLQYQIIISVAAVTKSLHYEVVSTQSITRSLQYAVIVPSSIIKTLEYRIVLETAITKSLQYITIKQTTVQKSLQYIVINANVITRTLKYDIVFQASITKGLRYVVLDETLITKALIYNIQSSDEYTRRDDYFPL